MGNIQNKNNTVQKIYKGEQLLIDTSGGGLNNSFPQSTEVKEVELPIELQGVNISYYAYNDEMFVTTTSISTKWLWKYNTTTSQWTMLFDNDYNFTFIEFNNKLWLSGGGNSGLYLYNGNTFDKVFDGFVRLSNSFEYNGYLYLSSSHSSISSKGLLKIDSNDNVTQIYDLGYDWQYWFVYNGEIYASSRQSSVNGIIKIDSNDNVTQIYDLGYDFMQSEIINDDVYFSGRNGVVKYSIIDNISTLIDTTSNFYTNPIYKYKTTLFFTSGSGLYQLASDGNSLLSIGGGGVYGNYVEYTDPSNNKEYLLISRSTSTNGLYVCFGDTLNTLNVWNSGYNFNYVFHYNGYNYITSSIGILEHDPMANTLNQVFTSNLSSTRGYTIYNNRLWIYGNGVTKINDDRTFTQLTTTAVYTSAIQRWGYQYFIIGQNNSGLYYVNSNETLSSVSVINGRYNVIYDIDPTKLYLNNTIDNSNVAVIDESNPTSGYFITNTVSNYDLYTDTTLNKNYFVCVKTDNSYLQVVDIENPTAIKGFVGGFEFNKYWFNQNGCTKFDESEGICYQYMTKYVPATAFNYIINQDNTIFYQILPNSLIYLVK